VPRGCPGEREPCGRGRDVERQRYRLEGTTVMRRVIFGTALVVGILLIAVCATYLRDMRRAYERIEGRSRVIASPFGDIEYVEGGNGPAVLVVHGSGGGWDQGELVARTVLGDRFHWVAPSRFGYLRSTFHAGATFDDQAHAYAFLLDHLGIRQVAVVALSHGGPSALLFAVLHPDRVTSLTLLSAGVASSASAEQAQANQKGDALTAIYQRDVRYWAMTTAFRGWFLGLMGATDDVAASLSDEQRVLVDQVVDYMNPVSRRAEGVRFDNVAAMPNERIAAIRAPTLILHAKDDTLQLYRNAEFAAATIPEARLVSFEKGGHLIMVVEQPSVRRLVEEHIVESEHRRHAASTSRSRMGAANAAHRRRE
jgi:2-hydroxy-6-oxonona-2,4-dienedioate hydrolase